MTNLYLDIETIPSQLDWVRDFIIDGIKHPGNIKKPESIEKWYEENLNDAIESALEKTALDGDLNHIVAIGYAVDDDPCVCNVAQIIDDEAQLLEDFFKVCTSLKYPTIIGHNVSQFDMKVIRHRALILGVPLPRQLPWAAKPWDNNPFDTMMQWDAKNYISLDKLCRAFGMGGKGDIDGSMVYKLWKNKEFDKLSAYCADDVNKVREIAKRMMQ